MELLWNLSVSALVIALGACLVLRWGRGLRVRPFRTSPPRPHPLERAGVQTGRRTLVRVFGAALGIRLAVFLLALLLGRPFGRAGETAHLWSSGSGGMPTTMCIWWSWAITAISKTGSTCSWCFFPLYVWVVRLVNLVVGNTLLAGMLVSWLCYAGGCVYLYRLAALDYGPPPWPGGACGTCPSSPTPSFSAGVMTEGLFLLTTCAALWQIRNHRWLSAGVWGALAALTRMHGLLLIGVTGAELCRAEQIFAPDGRSVGQRLWALVRRLPALLLPAVGTLGYLLVNLWVDGDPFAFTVHQEHWSQGFLWISQTLAYLVQNAPELP